MPESVATSADFELGRTALLEITPEATIGEPAGSVDEGDGVRSVYFDTTMTGYKGWRWTVSIAHIDGGDPTVLETELTPGETALLSPDWVPWSDRMADYKASQGETDAGEESEGDSDDDDDFDDDDVNDDDEALLHSGDLDGVDIDSLEDDSAEDGDDSGDDSDDDESAPAVGVEKADEPKRNTDHADPEPPAAARAKQRRSKKDNG